MRHRDWQQKFEAFIKTRQGLPFEWGKQDCATFSADCVLAITGNDVALPELRKHSTEKQAARLLKKHGGVVGIATAALGNPISPKMAQVGDVVLVESEGRDLLAICNGATCIAAGKHGLVHIGMHLAKQCWRVA